MTTASQMCEVMMSEPDDTMVFRIAGSERSGDVLLATTFAEAFDEWIQFVDQVALDFTSSRRSVDWVITNLSTGSAVLTVSALPRDMHGQLVGKQTAKRVLDVMEQYERGGAIRKLVSERAAVKFGRFAKIVAEGAVQSVSVVSGSRSALLESFMLSDRGIAATVFHAKGAIEGILVSVSFAKNPSFTIREQITQQLVTCYFEEAEFADDVIANLRRKVLVGGVITSRADGEYMHITDVDVIQVLRSSQRNLRLSDLAGIDPDLKALSSTSSWTGEQNA